MIDVAVIIVSWNVRNYLADCLRSVAADLRASRLRGEIWVVDNASTDGTADWLQTRGYTGHPRIACLRLPENRRGAGQFHDY